MVRNIKFALGHECHGSKVVPKIDLFDTQLSFFFFCLFSVFQFYVTSEIATTLLNCKSVPVNTSLLEMHKFELVTYHYQNEACRATKGY